MRSLLSRIFKENYFIATRARQLSRQNKILGSKSQEQKEAIHSDEEISQKEKEFLINKQHQDEQMKNQYQKQFQKAETKVRREPNQVSQEELIGQAKRRFQDSQKQEKVQTAKAKKTHNGIQAKFYDEKELTRLIRKQSTPEQLLKLYNGHKFTYSTKNLVHTLTHYQNLVRNEHQKKIKSSDRRLQTLLFTIQSYSSQLSDKEKTLVLWSLCKLGIKDDINEKLISELMQKKQILPFKDISIIIWVMGKQQIKNISQVNEMSLEIVLRLEDPYVKIETIDADKSKEANKAEKSNEEMEFEELEELLELPEFKENIVEPQSLMMVIQGLGKLGVLDEDLLTASSSIILKNIEQFSPLMISNVLYSFSTLKFKNIKVIEELAGHLKSNLDKLADQSVLTLKTLLVAISKLKLNDNELIIKIVNMILQKSKKQPLSGRFSAQIIYQLARSNIFDEKIYDNIASNSIKIAGEMNIQDCSEILYAFTKYIRQHKGLINSINLICLRIIELEGKLDKKSKDMIMQSLKIGNIQNKKLVAILQK